MLSAGEYMPFVSIDWTTVFQLCNTFILFMLMKKFFFVPVKNMIDQRQAEVASTYQEADKAKQEALALQKQYNDSLQNARSEAGTIVQEAAKQAQQRSDEILAEAQRRAAGLLERAEEQIERDKKQAVAEIRDEISGMAVAIAEKVMEKEIDESDHRALIDSFIEKMGDAAWKE